MPKQYEENVQLITNQRELFQWFARRIKAADADTPSELVALFDAVLKKLGSDGVWSYAGSRKSFARKVKRLSESCKTNSRAPIAQFAWRLVHTPLLADDARVFRVNCLAALLELSNAVNLPDGAVKFALVNNGNVDMTSDPGAIEVLGAEFRVTLSSTDTIGIMRVFAGFDGELERLVSESNSAVKRFFSRPLR